MWQKLFLIAPVILLCSLRARGAAPLDDLSRSDRSIERAASESPGGPARQNQAPILPLQAPVNAASEDKDLLPAGTIFFPATDLNQVLEVYAELVGRTVLRPTALPAGLITLKTQTPLTRREAIQALDAVFALNGIAVINVDQKFVKVVPAPAAGQVGGVFDQSKLADLPDLGQFVTHMVQLTNAKPSELVAVLTPFASPGLVGGILPVEGSQILVLRDYAENVKRMLEVVSKVDVAPQSEFISEVIPIKYAQAVDIANALNSLSGSGGVVGSSNSSGSRKPSARSATNPTQLTTPASAASTPTAPSSSFSDRLQRIVSRAASSSEMQILGETKIVADERTNALLIFASRADMKRIKKIISELDVVLAQVLIETVIMEVDLTSSQKVGVSYLQATPHGVAGAFLGQGALNNGNMLSSSAFNVINGATNATANLASGFSYLASLGNNDLDVSITALAASGRARILQRPRIQTSHGVPASIFIGESRPYPQGSYYGGASFGAYSTIQQLQIGVSLEVTPLINPDGLVVMDIHQKIDNFAGNVTIQSIGDVPIVSSKEASAKVAVRDRDTIVLGGLIEDTRNSNNSGIPFLKDIPLLGALFRSSSKDSTRSELIVLIRPTVLPTPEAAALVATSEKAKMPEVNRLEHEVQSEEASRNRRTHRKSD
jgi:general secretion pathway protein D